MAKSWPGCDASHPGAGPTPVEPLAIDHPQFQSTASTAPPPTTAWRSTVLLSVSALRAMTKNGVIAFPEPSNQRPATSDVPKPTSSGPSAEPVDPRKSTRELPLASPTAARIPLHPP